MWTSFDAWNICSSSYRRCCPNPEKVCQNKTEPFHETCANMEFHCLLRLLNAFLVFAKVSLYHREKQHETGSQLLTLNFILLVCPAMEAPVLSRAFLKYLLLRWVFSPASKRSWNIPYEVMSNSWTHGQDQAAVPKARKLMRRKSQSRTQKKRWRATPRRWAQGALCPHIDRIYIYMYIHIYIHTHIYIYIHRLLEMVMEILLYILLYISIFILYINNIYIYI